MPPNGEKSLRKNKAPKTWEEPLVRVTGGEEREAQWRDEIKYLATSRGCMTSAYPADTWTVFPVERTERLKEQLDEIGWDFALRHARFDLVYEMHARGMTDTMSHRLKSFFIDKKRIETKLHELIGVGRIRSATYLLRTVERFYPKLHIQPLDFREALPHYPALPVAYEEDPGAMLSIEGDAPPPLQDIIAFCTRESGLLAIQQLRHDLDKVTSSPFLSDEAKDSPLLRSLQMSLTNMEQSAAADIQVIAERLGKQFFAAVRHRLRARYSWSSQSVDAELSSCRDREDVLSVVMSICEELSYQSGKPWSDVAEGTVFFFTTLSRAGVTQGEVRAAADHLLDLVHNGGSMVGWLGRQDSGRENYQLNTFPTLFLEFRRYISSDRPAQEMIAFMHEFYKFSKTEDASDQFEHYWSSIEHGWTQTRSSAQIPRRFPRLVQMVRRAKEEGPGAYANIFRLIRYSHDDGHRTFWQGGDNTIHANAPVRFLNELAEADTAQYSRVEEMRATLERLKQTYGYKETM